MSWILWVFTSVQMAGMLDWNIYFLKQLNLWVTDQGIRMMRLTWNFIYGLILLRSFHPLTHPWLVLPRLVIGPTGCLARSPMREICPGALLFKQCSKTESDCKIIWHLTLNLKSQDLLSSINLKVHLYLWSFIYASFKVEVSTLPFSVFLSVSFSDASLPNFLIYNLLGLSRFMTIQYTEKMFMVSSIHH